jgi:hypothetical protein
MEELKKGVQRKISMLEVAVEAGQPNNVIIPVYKELKELQYQLLRSEIKEKKVA